MDTSPTTEETTPNVSMSRSDENTMSSDAALSGPPSLDYTLRTRKRAIFIFWSIVVFDSTAMPIALYFGLWYGTNLTPNTVFSIVTAALGGISIFEYFVRFWRLFKKGSTCRVIGGRRSYVREKRANKRTGHARLTIF